MSIYPFILHLQNPHLDCSYHYSSNFVLDFEPLRPVTHSNLKQFYNMFILHGRFIQERLLKLRIKNAHRIQLEKINNELNRNIARLYHVVSYGYTYIT